MKTNFYHLLQLKCCGVRSYEDWGNSTWDKDNTNKAVPPSCCKSENDKPSCYQKSTFDVKNIYTQVTRVYFQLIYFAQIFSRAQRLKKHELMLYFMCIIMCIITAGLPWRTGRLCSGSFTDNWSNWCSYFLYSGWSWQSGNLFFCAFKGLSDTIIFINLWMNVVKINKFILFIVFKRLFNKRNRKHFFRVPM
jgi:hypothetical protein